MSRTRFSNDEATAEQVSSYAAALAAFQTFTDAFAESAPDPETLDRLAADLRGWTEVLRPSAQPEPARLSGRLPQLPARGHAALPPFVVDFADPERVEAHVTFGSYFLGAGGAAHGGTIMTVLDEILGIQATVGDRGMTRTAYLKVDFRSIVPINTLMRVNTWTVREEGRKRFLRGEMWAGETLCAEADALFVQVRES